MAIKVFGLKSGLRLQRKDMYFQFSTSEQFTGMYWIDGKKIYCMTLKTDGNDKTNTTVYLSFNPTSLNEIIHIEGLCYCGADNRIVELNFPDTTANNIIKYLYEADNKRFAVYTRARSLNRLWITVYYTKTTG